VTVGLFGTGKIGLAVAKRFRAFGMAVVAYDPFAENDVLVEAGIERVQLEDLWQRSHLISLHAPATAETYMIVNAKTISMMQPGSYIVNTARGQLVNLDAVVKALDNGHLGGVALDVVDPEPLPRDHPIRDVANAILTPHTAFYSERSMDNLQRLAVEEAMRAFTGDSLRCLVNTPAGVVLDALDHYQRKV
jgi:D-3-phosphoglycerate dehydrogenase